MKKMQLYSVLALVIIHLVGIFIFINLPQAASLSYLIIIICSLIIFLGQDKRTLIPLIVTALGGFLIEWIGVHTGVLFGEYSYQTALGLKFLGIPIVIGLNWYCVVVSSVSISNYFNINIIVKALIAALLCTFLDFLIEPVAIKYGFWSWESPEIPIYNYICWFSFSFVFSLITLQYFIKTNKTATTLFVTWMLFFTILNFI